MHRKPRSHVIFRILKFPEIPPKDTLQKSLRTSVENSGAATRCHICRRGFFLFNCDNTNNLEKVEKFLLKEEEKYGFKFSVDRLYFGLQQMAELCDRIITTLDMDVAILVVHVHESSLSLMKKTGGLQLALHDSPSTVL